MPLNGWLSQVRSLFSGCAHGELAQQFHRGFCMQVTDPMRGKMSIFLVFIGIILRSGKYMSKFAFVPFFFFPLFSYQNVNRNA